MLFDGTAVTIVRDMPLFEHAVTVRETCGGFSVVSPVVYMSLLEGKAVKKDPRLCSEF